MAIIVMIPWPTHQPQGYALLIFAMLPIPLTNRTTAQAAPHTMIASSTLSHQVSRIRQFMLSLHHALGGACAAARSSSARQTPRTTQRRWAPWRAANDV